MTLNQNSPRISRESFVRALHGPTRRRSKVLVSLLAALALVILAVALSFTSHASTPPSGPIWGTLDSQPQDAAAENKAGVKMAMFELNWGSFETSNGKFSASYVSYMQNQLAQFQAAGQKITLGLGSHEPPAWVLKLANATYIDQNGNVSTEADWVYSAAVRAAALVFFQNIAKDFPLSDFYAIRITSGGDGEMLYPGGGTYWAFNPSALTGVGLPAGMTPNPDPKWKPGTKGLTAAQITTWVNWYVGGLDNVTNWQMTSLTGLGFTGYYETVTPGDGTRPDVLTQTEKANLSNDGTTGLGAVWNLYYAQLINKTNVIAYISSVADNSGGNDDCQASDTSLALGNSTMDSWSATRWITRLAAQYGLAVGGENPGYGLPASLDSFYTNTSSTGMMATALGMALSCDFKVFYWAHDIHLWDGTIPFSLYASSIAPYSSAPVNLALTGTVTANSTLSGFPASNANDGNLNTYWQATASSATLTLHLAQADPVARVVLELPQGWGTRSQTVEVDGSANGRTGTPLATSAVYQFTVGSNVVPIAVPKATETYLRLDISANTAQGAPQIDEFQASSS